MRAKIILGIDPGSHNVGIACLEKRGNKLKLLYAETIHAPTKKDIYTRLDHIAKKLNERIDELSPQEIAIEDIFFAKNTRSAFKLGVARGVAVAACLNRGIKIFEYAPTQVKSAVTGYGRAGKDQVRKMAALTLGTQLNVGFDAADAIAVAICHASQMNLGAQ